MYVGTDTNGEKVDISLGLSGWALSLTRATIILAAAVLCFGSIMLVRIVIELPFCRARRPLSNPIKRFFAQVAIFLIGLKPEAIGKSMRAPGMAVSNHSCWLDILPLIAYQRGVFVAKRGILFWPIIGQMVWAAGTVFIQRKNAHAAKHKALLEKLLTASEPILFFPEGMSNGIDILPFKSTLFEAAFSSPRKDALFIQPITVVYLPPKGRSALIYCWGRANKLSKILNILLIFGQFQPAKVRVIFGAPLKVADYPDRKSLAKAAEDTVRENFNRYKARAAGE